MSDRSRLRLLVLNVLVLSLLATLVGRLWFLQVVNRETYLQAADNTSLREVITPATRGLILDDQGLPLAANTTALVVSVSRATLAAQPDGGKALIERVAKVLGEPFATVWGHTRLCGEAGAPKPPTCWNGSPFQPIPVTSTASTAQALEIMEHQEDFPGVTAQVTTVRNYPQPDGANAAHVLGYLGPVTDAELAAQKSNPNSQTRLQNTDLVGRAGLEAQYDSYLRGTPGVTTVTVDLRNLVTGTVSTQAPVPGDYLVTSIDARVQAVAEQQLKAAIVRARTVGDINKGFKKYPADSGAVVVMDVKTGRIIAMASYPTYNPNIWVGGVTQKEYDSLLGPSANYPLISRAYQGEFAPGSTFKLISTPAAVKAGFSLNGTYDCPPALKIGNSYKTNYESESFGMISWRRAIQVSCDTVFYGMAYKTWLKEGGTKAPINAPDPFVTMAKDFGLGQPTGIDLPGEVGGRIADRQWKYDTWQANRAINCARAAPGFYDHMAKTDPSRAAFLSELAKENCAPSGYVYQAGDAANFAIGQGDTLLTPLQLARAYAAVANGGTLYQPEIGKAIVKPDGTLVKAIKPKVDGHLPISQSTLDWMKTTWLSVTTNGTGYYPFEQYAKFPLKQIPVASKTGTAEVYGKAPTSWFATFGPVNNPQYAIVMMVSQGGTGSGITGPSVEKIWEALYGVKGSTVNPAKALLPSPPAGLPTIRPDGTIVPPSKATPTATSSSKSTAAALGGLPAATEPTSRSLALGRRARRARRRVRGPA